MPTRWLAYLIVSAACSGQPTEVQAPPGGAAKGAAARWWCVYAADGFASHCDRQQSDCERVRSRYRRPAGPCAPEPFAHCFRYVSKGVAMSDTVVLACAALQEHCDERRGRVSETDQGTRMVGGCEVVD
jgi:hypothetical protein